MSEWFARYRDKLNNIEKNMGWVERQFYLGGHHWFVMPDALLKDNKLTTQKEIMEFKKLKEEFEKP